MPVPQINQDQRDMSRDCFSQCRKESYRLSILFGVLCPCLFVPTNSYLLFSSLEAYILCLIDVDPPTGKNHCFALAICLMRTLPYIYMKNGIPPRIFEALFVFSFFLLSFSTLYRIREYLSERRFFLNRSVGRFSSLVQGSESQKKKKKKIEKLQKFFQKNC